MKDARHLDANELLALVSPEHGEPAGRVVRHTAQCSPCRLEVEHFVALRNRTRVPAELPGEAALLRAYGLLRSATPRPAERVRYARPRLVYDSRTEAAVAGIRAPAPGRHLAWRGDAADVEVRWNDRGPTDAGVLTGQVLPRGELAEAPVGDVWLEQRGLPVEWCLLGPSGEFTLPAPHGRSWRILVRWGDLKLRLAP